MRGMGGGGGQGHLEAGGMGGLTNIFQPSRTRNVARMTTKFFA